MTRKRKRNLFLPKRVYQHGQRFRMRVYDEQRRPRWHYFKATDLDDLFPEYSRFLRKRQKIRMSDVFDRYEAQELPRKAPDTQISDRKALKALRAVFSPLRPQDIRPDQIVAYVDSRADSAPIRGNREADLLTHVLTKCRHWGILTENPAQKLRYRNPELPRTRYVTDRELWVAMRRAPPIVRYAMRLAAITGLRRRDVLSLQWEYFGPDGLTVTLSKSRRRGGIPKRMLYEWCPALEKLHARLLAISKSGKSGPVFYMTEKAFGRAWSRLQDAIAGDDIQRFQFKDLRAKFGTDVQLRGGDATKNLAHSNASTTQRHYTRLPVRIDLR